MAAPGSLAEAQEMYAAYIAAEKKVLSGQEYYIRDRRLRMADLVEIRNGQQHWLNQVISLQNPNGGGGGLTVGRFIPVDD